MLLQWEVLPTNLRVETASHLWGRGLLPPLLQLLQQGWERPVVTPLETSPLPVLVVTVISERRRALQTLLDHQPWSVFVAYWNKAEKVSSFFYSSLASEDVKLPSCSSRQAADIIQFVVMWQRSQRGWKTPKCAQSPEASFSAGDQVIQMLIWLWTVRWRRWEGSQNTSSYYCWEKSLVSRT